MKPTTDPYRVLGVLRGADQAQIKAAHRRLAKQFHPDSSPGSEVRFLAVQEAYQLLSDPTRRRDWDRRHAPGPVPATDSARSRATYRTRRRPTGASVRRGTPRQARPQRQPGQRKTTWSAEHVPWWDEFEPRAAGEHQPRHAERPATDAAPPAGEPRSQGMDFDVFNRSSGAAWSSAARRHFRRGTDDLPSRGAWRYRGTQVVTGAEARKVAAEEEEEKRRS